MPFAWERPPVADKPLSVIVPFRQAAVHLTSVVAPLVAQLEKRSAVYEILLVDDASTDDSTVTTTELVQRYSKLKALRHDQPQGYGAALRTGLAAAQYPLIATLPADGSYDPADLPKFLAAIDEADVVSGCRKSKPWLKRQLQGWPAYLFFGVGLKDVACHFRLYRRAVFDRIPVQSKGCFADTEILAKANFLDCILTEVDITWKPPTATADLYGSSILGDAFRLLRKPEFRTPPAPHTAAG